MTRLRAWLRYRGWRNAYWREDWYMAICPHSGPVYVESSARNKTLTLRLCVDCGKSLRQPERTPIEKAVRWWQRKERT